MFAPALYEADRHFIVPRIDDKGYLDIILKICRENEVNAVLSLIDPELTLLAEHEEDFLEIGTVPIISDKKVVELCFDKYAMYEFLTENGFKTARSYIDKEAFYTGFRNRNNQIPSVCETCKRERQHQHQQGSHKG